MEKEQQQLAALVRGKKVAFIGAGVSHKTLIEEFVGLGAEVTLCDKKPSLEAFGEYAGTLRRLGVRLSLGEGYMEGFKGQDIILRTPGFEYYQKPLQDAIAAGAMVTSEVELFFDFCPCEIVAVTGSDGKTTTTTLISEMFKAAGRRVHLGGNIGAALLPMLPEVAPEDVAVVELSSFQLISMRKSPRVAVVTNVTPNHLDHHKDMQEYIDAKRNILLYQTPPCRAVLGYENEITRAMQADCRGEQVWFTRLHETDNGAFLRADVWVILAGHGRVGHYDELACLPVLVVLHRASPVICNAGKPPWHLQLYAEAEQVGHLRAVAGFHLLPHGYPAFGGKHISHGQRGLHLRHGEGCHEPCASVASAVNVQPLQSHGRILPYGHLFLQAGTIIKGEICYDTASQPPAEAGRDPVYRGRRGLLPAHLCLHALSAFARLSHLCA